MQFFNTSIDTIKRYIQNYIYENLYLSKNNTSDIYIFIKENYNSELIIINLKEFLNNNKS